MALSDRWDFPQEYVDRVAAARGAEATMALMQEALEHGDMFGYNRAVQTVIQQDILRHFQTTPKRSLTWSEAMGGAIMETNLLPWVYHHAHVFDVLKHEERPEALTWAWTDAEWPEQYMATELWLEYFKEAGFVEDEEIGTLPTEPIVLWRGATEERADGMAWTERPEVANWFAKRWVGIEDSAPVKVYRITAYPDILLAHFTGRGEDEWLVDPEPLGWNVLDEYDVDELPEFHRPVHKKISESEQ